MFDLKECVMNGLEQLSIDIALDSASSLFWGEVEMPECLREEVEEV